MYTVLIGYDGYNRANKHQTFAGANKEFARVSKNLAFPDDFPAWRGVALCEGFKMESDIITPVGIIVEAHRND
jgi:hypothetical protein